MKNNVLVGEIGMVGFDRFAVNFEEQDGGSVTSSNVLESVDSGDESQHKLNMFEKKRGDNLDVQVLGDLNGDYSNDDDSSDSNDSGEVDGDLERKIKAGSKQHLIPRKHNWLARWVPPLGYLGNGLRRLFPKIVDEAPPQAGSLVASWFLSPEQHVLEFFFFTALAIVGLILFVPQLPSAGLLETRDPRCMAVLWTFTAIFVLSFCYAIFYKIRTKTLVFLLQPCHVLTTLELLVILTPTNLVDMTPLFNLILYWLWAPLLALLTPDLREYHHWADIFNFFFQHVILISFPIFLLLTRQFDFYDWSWSYIIVADFILVLFHWTFLVVIGMANNTNLNYLLAPAPGLLVKFGKFYRLFMFFLGLSMCFVSRIIMVGGSWYCYTLIVSELKVKL